MRLAYAFAGPSAARLRGCVSGVCIIFGGENEDAAVARFRAERDWPDDGGRPIRVLRVEFVKAEQSR